MLLLLQVNSVQNLTYMGLSTIRNGTVTIKFLTTTTQNFKFQNFQVQAGSAHMQLTQTENMLFCTTFADDEEDDVFNFFETDPTVPLRTLDGNFIVNFQIFKQQLERRESHQIALISFFYESEESNYIKIQQTSRKAQFPPFLRLGYEFTASLENGAIYLKFPNSYQIQTSETCRSRLRKLQDYAKQDGAELVLFDRGTLPIPYYTEAFRTIKIKILQELASGEQRINVTWEQVLMWIALLAILFLFVIVPYQCIQLFNRKTIRNAAVQVGYGPKRGPVVKRDDEAASLLGNAEV